MSVEKRLYRSRTNRMFAGVAGGLGDYFSVDPTIVRLLLVFGGFFAGSGLLIYLVMMLVVPEEPLDRPIETVVVEEEEEA